MTTHQQTTSAATNTNARAWLAHLPENPAAVSLPVTITLDASTWATVAHRARQQGESIDHVLSAFILDGGLGGIAEHLQASSRGN